MKSYVDLFDCGKAWSPEEQDLVCYCIVTMWYGKENAYSMELGCMYEL